MVELVAKEDGTGVIDLWHNQDNLLVKGGGEVPPPLPPPMPPSKARVPDRQTVQSAHPPMTNTIYFCYIDLIFELSFHDSQ